MVTRIRSINGHRGKPVMMAKRSEDGIADPARLSATVYGRVQGVFFRHFVRTTARRIGLAGYVRNLACGNAVEVQAEGARRQLQELLRQLKTGPPGANVDRVEETWSDHSGEFTGFSIRH